jgi:deoxyribonuclease-4
MIIGCHVQMKAPDFVLGSVTEALSYGANACMLYTGAPQNTKRRPIAELKADEARKLMAANKLPMERMVIHAPYIINPANSVKPEVAELAVDFLQQEAERTHEIGARYLVLHPGSYTTTDLATGMQTICRQLDQVDVPSDVMITLETMAGKGSEVGWQFEQLAEILNNIRQKDRYGVCLDTCHIHDAGYDLTHFDEILDTFDHVIGLSHLHVIHLNDSKNETGSKKDRHANIGQGTIGFDTLRAIAVNPRTEDVIKILETPYINDKPPYGIEIEMLKSGIYDPKRLEL